jgi:hypothetical protein
LRKPPARDASFCNGRRLADGPGRPPCGVRRPPLAYSTDDPRRQSRIPRKLILDRSRFCGLNGENGFFARRGRQRNGIGANTGGWVTPRSKVQELRGAADSSGPDTSVRTLHGWDRTQLRDGTRSETGPETPRRAGGQNLRQPMTGRCRTPVRTLGPDTIEEAGSGHFWAAADGIGIPSPPAPLPQGPRGERDGTRCSTERTRRSRPSPRSENR